MGLLVDRYDQKVWDVIKHPKYVTGGQVVGPFAPPLRRVPYTVTEIAATVGRKVILVTSSLRRLEKRGKIMETHDGWLAKT
jgi:hypothetical protein